MGTRLEVSIQLGKVSRTVAQNKMKRYLQVFVATAHKELQTYPAWQPWTSRPPKTGPRAGGKRTGTLGGNWSFEIKTDEATVFNNTSYAKWVNGPNTAEHGAKPTQTKVAASRGWKSTSDVAKKASDAASKAARS